MAAPTGSSPAGVRSGKHMLCLSRFCLLHSLILRGPVRGLAEEGASPCAGISSFILKTLDGRAQDTLAARVCEQGLETVKDTGAGAL